MSEENEKNGPTLEMPEGDGGVDYAQLEELMQGFVTAAVDGDLEDANRKQEQFMDLLRQWLAQTSPQPGESVLYIYYNAATGAARINTNPQSLATRRDIIAAMLQKAWEPFVIQTVVNFFEQQGMMNVRRPGAVGAPSKGELARLGDLKKPQWPT